MSALWAAIAHVLIAAGLFVMTVTNIALLWWATLSEGMFSPAPVVAVQRLGAALLLSVVVIWLQERKP